MDVVAAPDTLTVGQRRAARAMLGWSIAETARRASVSPISVLLSEKEERPVSDVAQKTLAKAYQAAGIVFHGSTSEGFGLTLTI